MQKASVCVLRMEGTNCEYETVNAFKAVGADAEAVHIKQLSEDASPEFRRDLEGYDILAIPGGAAGGDYVRAGALFAARIRATVGKEVDDFAESGKPVLGICNGFQTLAELGLLPAFGGKADAEPVIAFAANASARFECRTVRIKHENKGSCRFTSEVPAGAVLEMPVACGEGRLISADPDFIGRLEDNDQIVFRYVGPDDGEAEYPWNPSGTQSGVAAICNPAGNVLGIMPHPERVMTRFTHPAWTRGYASEQGDGWAIFESAVGNLLK